MVGRSQRGIQKARGRVEASYLLTTLRLLPQARDVVKSVASDGWGIYPQLEILPNGALLRYRHPETIEEAFRSIT
jgi:hypothetical protein